MGLLGTVYWPYSPKIQEFLLEPLLKISGFLTLHEVGSFLLISIPRSHSVGLMSSIPVPAPSQWPLALKASPSSLAPTDTDSSNCVVRVFCTCRGPFPLPPDPFSLDNESQTPTFAGHFLEPLLTPNSSSVRVLSKKQKPFQIF